MALNSSIEWTQASWNPITGCTKISEGCRNCYAERMAKRLKAMGQKNYRNGFEVTIHEDMFEHPLRWKKPKMIFVNSMSDLFHESVPFDVIERLLKIMNDCRRHTFQILTKRANLLSEYGKYLNWADNIWMGVTVESGAYISRVDHLRNTNARIKFISFEPLLSEIKNCSYSGIDWVIAGGESGCGCRTVKKEWVVSIRNDCTKNRIPFFFKQWGGTRKKNNGRMLDNKVWDEMPQVDLIDGEQCIHVTQ